MGFQDYQFSDTIDKQKAEKEISPVWRGVGCLLAVFLSVIGFYLGAWFLQANAQNNWIFLPSVLIRPPYVDFLPPGILVQCVLASLFLLFGYGLISFAYALIFPKQLGETDAPPMKRRRSSRWRSGGR